MSRHFSALLGTATLAASALVLGTGTTALGHNGGHGGGGHGGGGHSGGGHNGGHAAYAGHGGYGGYHGGPYHGGYYHNYYHGGYYGGFRPYGYGGFYPGYGYGFYRPYYGYGLGGFGLGGYGLGGYGLGGYGLGGYGLGGYGLSGYAPYYGGYGSAAPVGAMTPPNAYANQPAAPPTAENPPPPDNAAHLQLIVPENANVLFDDGKTTQTGTAREFVSPPLPAGKVWTYKISVRYSDPNGKPIDDTRRINVRANDWFRIDFTQPAPPEQAPAPTPAPRP